MNQRNLTPRRRNNRQPILVSDVQSNSMPSGVLNIDVNRVYDAAGTGTFSPKETDIPTRPSSLVVNLASAAPVSWIVRAVSAGTTTFESRPFVTSGNSITVKVRNTRSADFAPATTGGGLIGWQIVSSGAGLAAGVATFATRGTSAME